MNVYFNRRKDPKRYEEMFLWSNLSELDAKYLQLIIITRTPVTHCQLHEWKTLRTNPVIFEERKHKEMGETCLGLLPSAVPAWCSPQGHPSPQAPVSPPAPPSWHPPCSQPANGTPKGCCGERRGDFYTQKCLLNCLLDANERSGRLSIVGESLNGIGSG